jgi:hypothetical protein
MFHQMLLGKLRTKRSSLNYDVLFSCGGALYKALFVLLILIAAAVVIIIPVMLTRNKTTAAQTGKQSVL